MGAARRPAARNDALQQIGKILQLERNKGCTDDAVYGGLDAFLRTVRERDGLPAGSPVVQSIDSLPAEGYRSLPVAERRRWIDATLAAAAGRPAPPARKRAPAPRRAAAPESDAGVDAPVTVLKGVKTAMAARLENLGVRTIRDLLYLFPRRHNDFASMRKIGDLTPGDEQTVRAEVWSAEERQLGRRRGTDATIGDTSGTMRVVWFNQPWIARQLRTNAKVVVAGRVSLYKGRPTFENPEWELSDPDEQLTHTGRLVPVYPLTEGISSRTVRRLTRQALDTYLPKLPDALPDSIRDRLGLLPAQEAVSQAHYPESHESLASARRRLALEELLPLQISVLLRRRAWQRPGTADPLPLPDDVRAGFVASLPFALTGAQQKSLDAVASDLARDFPMSRLLQGDVGSGKTVVAACGLVAAVASGHQAVMMAPTEILANQHFATLQGLFAAEPDETGIAEANVPYLDRPLRIALLTGSMRAAARREITEAVASGSVDVVAGTHALIQESVSFAKLGLAVVDEQHRFGVMQRGALRGKHVLSEAEGAERTAHMLVMTATPIPRSLYLTLYGDLDVSVIDELPPGRKPVQTRWWPPDKRDDAYAFLRKQIDAGRQAFVICPLVEESESLQSKSAVQEHERLSSEVFPDLTLELVHGRMSGRDKDTAMERFRSGEAQILVSTAVVEVGIDVPNATVMLIEGADRFGLAQLHQFRGRVGRGADQSYCLLLSESPSLDAQQRLRLMEETTDGFRLAEADLELRGPGEFFGTRQSGLPDFRIASLLDTRLIEVARTEAARIIETDPDLSQPEHAPLAALVAQLSERVTAELH